jgi:hypothetical protein
MDTLQTFADSFPAALQWFAIMLVGAIPFVESYGGAVLGVVVGIPVPIAILAAVIGNVIAMALAVVIASSIREKATARAAAKAGGAAEGTDGDGSSSSGRGKDRIRRIFERYGVPGVSILGQWALPSHVTAPTLVGFGASRGSVLVWQTVGILLWGITFGALAAPGINLAMR